MACKCNLIPSDPPCNDNGNARLTMVPLKALSDQVWFILPIFLFL